jgi:inner membrane protein
MGEVTATWGGPQAIAGPRLVLPYRRAIPGSTEGAGDVVQVGRASFLPENLTIQGEVTTEALARGLFTVPVYRARLVLRGRFERPDLEALGLRPQDVEWERASLALELPFPKSVGGGSSVSWNGSPVDLLPGTGSLGQESPGLHSPVPLIEAGGADFEVRLDLKGSQAIWFVPIARTTRVALTSDWGAPSFAGAWPPARRSVEDDGFSAEWEVPFLGRDYPQQWLATATPGEQILASRFGAELISPVDPYRMSERSTKYAPLFLLLTLGMLWVFDTLVGLRVHAIQYTLVGAAMCVFYLLELSLSEHIGFVSAYTTAAAGVVALVASYTKVVLRSAARGVTMAGALGLLYAYLLALLSLERYALLAGSLGLFTALAAIMYLTRWVDWGVDRGRERVPTP